MLALLPALVLQNPPAARSWEKPIAPGLTYRMETDPAGPFVFHSFKVSPRAPGLRVVPALAGTTVYGPAPFYGRGTVTQMADEVGAIAAINTDYFPLSGNRATGDPLGAFVADGELVSVPGRKRAAFGWGPGGAQGGFLDWTGTVSVGSGAPLALQGLNEESGLNRIVLNTDRAGLAIAKAPCAMIAIQLDVAGPLLANAPRTGKIVGLETDITERPVPTGQVILCAQGPKIAALGDLRLGDSVRFNFETRGFDFAKFPNVVGGGPFLLRDGKVAVDGAEEGFNEADFVQKRHPRSAVGRTATGDLIFFAVDGRTAISVGMSLPELALKMARLGCVEAVNLDGGGSTALSLFGAALNRPSDGRERAVAAGVVFYGETAKDSRQPTLVFRRAEGSGYVAILQLGGKPVPNAEIVWSAVGDAWIDQGGAVAPLKDGTVTVRAAWKGRVIANAYPVKVEKKPKAKA